ncbi:MAG: GlsB/YeaQ/YmgE family stress response membrane protein [Candidatus Cryosericum sp.]
MPDWVWFIIIGIAAGWLAGQVMKGSGYGLIGDLVIGAIGGLVGGYIFGLLKIKSSGLLGSLITAVVGAILLIIVVRAVRGGRRRR